MSEFWSDAIRGLEPYTPGEQPRGEQLVKLNTNENPYPPSPAVLDAIRAAVDGDLRLYPDPDGLRLRETIATLHGLTPDHVFLGNGSDEVLAHAFLGLLKHARPILFPDITYSFYPVYCALYDIAYETVPLDDAYAVDPCDYARECGGIVLPNPNAPTGRPLGRDALRAIARGAPDAVVLFDEAYVDFGAESAVPLVREHPNVLVVQTVSKARSLAGLRVGYAIGDPALVAALNVVKGSFNAYPLDRLALAGAQAAFEDATCFETTRQRIMASRERLASELAALGFDVLPSLANFVFARHPDHGGAALQQRLREQGILVRHFAKPRIEDFLRITIGTDEECAALVAALRTLLG